MPARASSSARSAASTREAPEPEWRSTLAEPVLTEPGRWLGLARALDAR